MKFVKFSGSAGCCGTDYEEYGKFDDDITDDEICDISEQICSDWVDSYGIDIDEEEEESGVEYEYDHYWEFVNEEDVDPDSLKDYTR